jgi:hypothetical protein
MLGDDKEQPTKNNQQNAEQPTKRKMGFMEPLFAQNKLGGRREASLSQFANHHT